MWRTCSFSHVSSSDAQRKVLSQRTIAESVQRKRSIWQLIWIRNRNIYIRFAPLQENSDSSSSDTHHQLELGNILIQFNQHTAAKAYFEEVRATQTDPSLIALCNAAIVTALHLEGSTDAALTLCVVPFVRHSDVMPRKMRVAGWRELHRSAQGMALGAWRPPILRRHLAHRQVPPHLRCCSYDDDDVLPLLSSHNVSFAAPLLASLQAGFKPAPDGHFQLALGHIPHVGNFLLHASLSLPSSLLFHLSQLTPFQRHARWVCSASPPAIRCSQISSSPTSSSTLTAFSHSLTCRCSTSTSPASSLVLSLSPSRKSYESHLLLSFLKLT